MALVSGEDLSKWPLRRSYVREDADLASEHPAVRPGHGAEHRHQADRQQHPVHPLDAAEGALGVVLRPLDQLRCRNSGSAMNSITVKIAHTATIACIHQ